MFSRAKKILLIIFGLLFFVSATSLFAIATHWDAFRKVEQKRFHGQILNLTNKPLRFTHTEGTTTLPAWTNSLETGVLDADGLIIDHPVRMGRQLYKEGTFVLCDFGKLTLKTTANGEDVLEGSPGTLLCRIFHDYGIHPKLEAIRNNVTLHLW